jgi:hypothetical protein
VRTFGRSAVKEHLPLSLERTASVRARADRGEPLDRVLAAEGLTLDVFHKALRGWLGRIGAETKRRRHALGQRYQEAYFAERPDLVAAPAPAREDVDATGIGLVLDLGEALPFVSKGAPRAVEPPSGAEADEPSEPRRLESADDRGAARAVRESVDETGFIDALALDLEALPFGKGTEPRADPVGDAQTPPLPFQPPSLDPAPRVERPPELDGTAFMAPIAIDEPLPFRGRAPAPPSAAAEVAAEAADLAGETSFVPALSDADLGLEAGPALSLERYASLLVDLERAHDPADALARYGLSAAAFESERAAWAPRLADAATAARLREAMQQYRAWLAQR